MTPPPLDGVRVLDLTRLLPGAYATLLLADLGADVVKIEDPRGGDPARTMPPVAHGTRAYFDVLNRNKRSVALDLRSPDARPVMDALIARADVLVESFRPQTSRRLGVDAESVRARHPRVIYASLDGFSRTSRFAGRAAHDINFEGLAGLLTLDLQRAERGEGAPAKRVRGVGAPGEIKVPGMLIGDIGAALHAAAGILAALYQRERTGAGALVEASIHDAALSWLLFPAARRLAGEDAALDLPVGGTHACYNVYRARDGRFLALGALEPKFWKTFCERIGRGDLAARQYDADQTGTVEEIRTLMRTRTASEWLALFEDADVCLTPVVDVDEALADPDLAKRGLVVRRSGRTYISAPVAIGDRVAVRPAPLLGENTEEVLEEAGVPAAERARRRARGVV